MRLQYPYLLLAIVPVLVLWWRFQRQSGSSLEKKRLPLLVAALACLLMAGAKPYWGLVEERQLVKGLDLILILDVSQSMFCEDGTPRRIDQARQFLRTFLREFSGSSVALVYFAGDAQLGSPFTTDLRAIHIFLDSIAPAMTGNPGSRSQPLQQVLQELLHTSQTSPLQRPHNKMALLFSDGEFADATRNLERWLKARHNFSLYTFLCGNRPTAVPKFDLTGPYPGATSQVRPENLMRLSGLTGGKHYRLSHANPAAIQKELSKNVRTLAARGRLRPNYRLIPFLLTGCLFLISYQLFPLFQRSQRMSLALLILLSGLSAGMKSEDDVSRLFAQALDDAKQKRYEAALQKMQLLQSRTRSEEIEVAIGNIYALQAKYDKAIESYRKALLRNPWNSRARWNWEVALKKKSSPNQPPEPEAPPNPPPPAPEIPPETSALLNYFDQLEQQQLKENNTKKPDPAAFAW